MIALRFLLSWAIFFVIMRAVTWPLSRMSSAKKNSDFVKKKGQRLRATPLKECAYCSLRVPEEQGAFFGEAFFCSEPCRRAYYS